MWAAQLCATFLLAQIRHHPNENASFFVVSGFSQGLFLLSSHRVSAATVATGLHIRAI